MANIKNLTVVKCTPSTKGGFLLKLQSKAAKQLDTAFGSITQTSQETYYMKVGTTQPVGKVADLDIDLFKVTELPFTIPAQPTIGTPGQPEYKEATMEEVIQLKWLFL